MARRPVRPSTPRTCALLIACVAGVACHDTVVLQSEISERDAARGIAVLHAHHIAVQRTKTNTRGTDASFDLRVAAADVATACRLVARGASGDDAPESDSAKSAFIPTPREERARAHAAMETDLAQAIALWDGVTDVKVLIVDAQPPSKLGEAPSPPHAAVTVVHLPGKAPDTDAIARLVSHVIGSTDSADVLVSFAETQPVRPRPLAQLGPITVTASSAPTLKIVLASLLVLTTILATLLLWALRRRAR